jgi:predicted AAA+ superfamily ATPase
VFRVQQYRKKKNAEIGRLRKVYFYDLGVRNALIGKFDAANVRDDTGALWENYCLIERRKKYQRGSIIADQRYWRARNGQEVDLIETVAGKSSAFEFKYGIEKSYRTPKGFVTAYPEIDYKVINPENIQSYLN